MYLGVLHTEHWRVGLLFLEAGKNMLCEKPFAMNSGQVKDLVAAAKKNNVFLMEVSLKGYSYSCRPLPRGHSLAVGVIAKSKIKLCLEVKTGR